MRIPSKRFDRYVSRVATGTYIFLALFLFVVGVWLEAQTDRGRFDAPPWLPTTFICVGVMLLLLLVFSFMVRDKWNRTLEQRRAFRAKFDGVRNDTSYRGRFQEFLENRTEDEHRI